MTKALAVALILGLAACGEKAKYAPVSDTPAPKMETAGVVKPDPDKELAHRVVRAIEEAKLHGVDAVAVDGVVTLWGSAVSVKERDRAGQVAARVEGVQAVENRLEIVTGS